VVGGDRSARAAKLDTVRTLREIAIRALERMYLPERGMFAFRIRKTDDGGKLEGVSRRYTAAALIGLTGETKQFIGQVFTGDHLHDVYDRLAADVETSEDLGEVALALWAGRALAHRESGKILRRLVEMNPPRRACSTVALGWALTALSIQSDCPTNLALAHDLAARLVRSQVSSSGLFPHWPAGAGRHWLRGHVACFADLVYPVQALALFAKATGTREALHAAASCAHRMCHLQGPEGQWWWHYDVRTGKVLEKYPVYSVHQDSMAVMALSALRDAGGQEYAQTIYRSLEWMTHSPEIDGSLIDRMAGVIWRKVARHDPMRASRRLQAAASRLHPRLRAPLIDRILPPHQVDYESRPYHMGWILYAWGEKRSNRPVTDQSGASPRA